MASLLFVTTALSACLAVGVVSCGGSASETPWPAEPIDLEPGPAGEELTRGNVVDTKKLPDNYTKQKAADPESAPTPEGETAPEDEATDEVESPEEVE